MSIALPISGLRRGACPSLDAPMQTGDGLLARLRVSGGRLTPVALGKLANIAGSFGNGSIEITARGNLQVRGLRAAGAASFARAVEAVIGIERGLVVETPPLAGDDPHELADPRPVARLIRDGAAALAVRLGPKVTVIVDGNGQVNLADLKADIRLVATEAGSWTVAVGRHFFGATTQPAEAARAVLGLLANQGSDARATDLQHIVLLAALGHLCTEALRPAQPRTSPVGRFELRSVGAVGLGLSFGACPWEDLLDLAALATSFGVTQFRLAPHHALLAIGAPSSMHVNLAESSFITDPTDPRRRISACIGSGGCASGHIAARQVASRLAASVDHHGELHVSGCAKGCAHPRRAALTVVGRPDGYGLVIDGTAGDTPVAVLRADQLDMALGPAAQG
ncbi:MAG TPA: precorrin-3B synthase [Devosia sp.]|jgi:precorrin-3B synthase|nr:precorrin-3B synthase [Devosia sp.]